MGSAMIATMSNTVPVVGTAIDVVNVPANSPWQAINFEHQELTLLPGDSYSLSATPNTALQAGFWWRERFLEESERT
jgi:hypothetical protein